MKRRLQYSVVIVAASLALLGFGCSSSDKPWSYHEVFLKKIGFVAHLPDTWQEDPRTAAVTGPADYDEFIIPPHKSAASKDVVAGVVGFRLAPRIVKNTMDDELTALQSFVKASAGEMGGFDPITDAKIGNMDARQMRWHGMTKEKVLQSWYYTVTFVGDNMLLVYYTDEDDDMATYKPIYDHILASVEKR